MVIVFGMAIKVQRFDAIVRISCREIKERYWMANNQCAVAVLQLNKIELNSSTWGYSHVS